MTDEAMDALLDRLAELLDGEEVEGMYVRAYRTFNGCLRFEVFPPHDQGKVFRLDMLETAYV